MFMIKYSDIFDHHVQIPTVTSLKAFHLILFPDRYAICRLEPGDSLPPWINHEGFLSITHTTEELSIVCQEAIIPPAIPCQAGWHMLKFEGTFDFSQTGVLASVTLPLAEAGISILAISTYNTDYVLIQTGQLEQAIQVLQEAGHTLQYPGDCYVPEYQATSPT